MTNARPIALLGALALLAACGPVRDAAVRLFDDRPPRARYEARLESAGLGNAALARDWLAAARDALRSAPLVSSPHREEGYLSPSEPAAIALRVNLRRGQEVAFEMNLVGDTTTLVFVDAWQIDGESEDALRLLTSADSGARRLVFEPRRDGEYIFRAQPELLRGGRFTASLIVAPTLAFPVQGRRERDIGSRFGAPRDAGARSHHGVDIFAPRGTPAIAAAPATVTRVQTTDIGGNVVWLRDQRGNSLYYAHLDRQAVAAGEHVVIGDTIGFVGNTGNARTTPPHLHFGVYRRGEGPVDPYWFVHEPPGTVPRLVADTTLLGVWARAAADRVLLRAAPATTADTVALLSRHAIVRVVAAVGGWYRVRQPDGVSGYLQARAVEPSRSRIRSAAVPAASPLLARPVMDAEPADIVRELPAGTHLDVLGRFGPFALVTVSGGAAAWVAHPGGAGSTDLMSTSK
jgi:peptidoglycan LD-endopeptidase LytH